jgi:hypothetical protein
MTITDAAGRGCSNRIVAGRRAVQNPAFVGAPFGIGERVAECAAGHSGQTAFTKIFAAPCELPLLT